MKKNYKKMSSGEVMKSDKPSLDQFLDSSCYEICHDQECIIYILELLWNLPFKSVFHIMRQKKSPNPLFDIYRQIMGINEYDLDQYYAFLELSFGEVAFLLGRRLNAISDWEGNQKRKWKTVSSLAELYMYFPDFME